MAIILERPPRDTTVPETVSPAEETLGDAVLPRRLPATTDASRAAMEVRHLRLRQDGYIIDELAGCGPENDPASLAGRIEGFVGFARVPLGVAGPIRIRGSAAQGDFFVPLATSEGTLVASFQHAFNAINRCGGAVALCGQEKVSRAPCFEFESLVEAGHFAAWLPSQLARFQELTAGNSGHCRLQELRTSVVGNTAYVVLEFSTGDAAGQNMVTAAAQVICESLLAGMPAKPVSWMVESTLSGDKRPSAIAFRGARGRNVSAEVVLPAKQIERYWRATAFRFAQAWSHSVNGIAQTGTIGLQGNVANALAAVFIACGQDVACVSEAVTAITRIERTASGDIYASVTLPNLIVGTVGGGTSLATARECLAMLGCVGAGSVRKFAEICAVVALAGELAVLGAMSGGSFASAHAAGCKKAREA
ncbi:MAG: hydroxymethylglutaryl-CoA reductase [Steroidobacterales bacterium]